MARYSGNKVAKVGRFDGRENKLEGALAGSVLTDEFVEVYIARA